MGPSYLKVPHPWIQPTVDQKYLMKRKKKKKKAFLLSLFPTVQQLLASLCVVLGIVSVIQMIESIQEDVHILHKGLLQLWILIFAGGPGTNPSQIARDN